MPSGGVNDVNQPCEGGFGASGSHAACDPSSSPRRSRGFATRISSAAHLGDSSEQCFTVACLTRITYHIRTTTKRSGWNGEEASDPRSCGPSHSGFFYDKGQPRGIYYEALNEFQSFVNIKLRTGRLKINVTFIPVRPEQLESALLEGVGDVVAYGVIVTPEREKKVLFTTPIASDVKQVIVSGPNSPPIASLEDLSGKEVYVNPLTVYYENLQRLSDSLRKAGRPAIRLRKADANLTDEDLLEMVNAGLIPATVTINVRAQFWSKVFSHLTIHPNIALAEDGQLAFATRRDSPKLKELLDEFIKAHGLGISFGNTFYDVTCKTPSGRETQLRPRKCRNLRPTLTISSSTLRNIISII